MMPVTAARSRGEVDRRSFLRLLTLAVAGTTLDPERLLWVPKPMIVVPAMPFTLADWARRMDPDGKAAQIVELLSQSNAILADLQWMAVDRSVKTMTKGVE